jgi:2,4-dienoyl-CoA reductase (NADPH2)
MGNVVRYLDRLVRKLPIDLRMNTEVGLSLVGEIKPDVVILAGGGKAPVLEVSGGDSANVLDHRDMKEIMAGHGLRKGGPGQRLVSRLGAMFIRFFYEPSLIRWMLRFGFPFRKRVAIVGGGFAGCELGVTLVERGKKVAIIEKSKRMGYDVGLVHRWVWMRQLREAGARLETEADVVEIMDRGVRISKAGATELVEADTVVLAGELTPDAGFAEQLSGRGFLVCTIGDCAEPGKLLEATASGFLVGQSI